MTIYFIVATIRYMEVTFDPAKNKINIKKHGISLQRTEDFDFVTAFYDVDDSPGLRRSSVQRDRLA